MSSAASPACRGAACDALVLAQAEIDTLRESNAWYRARNIELLRMLSGRKDHPGDPDPHAPPQPFVRHGRANLGLGHHST